jgi:hypothetical protein
MTTRRTRSILVDNTLGKIFTNVSSVSTSNSSNLIAGTKIQSATISSGSKTTLVLTKNLGKGIGISFPRGGLITNVQLSLSGAATGQSVIVDVKVGTSYANSSTVTTATLPVNTLSTPKAVSISVQSGQYVYLDVTQTGNIKPGNGLSVRLDYYTG